MYDPYSITSTNLVALARYLAAYQLPQARTLLRLDGQYPRDAQRV